MEVSVKLFGGLRAYLPAGSSFNGCRLSLEENASLGSLLQQLPIPSDKAYIVIINDEKVDAKNYDGLRVSADDDIVLIPPIKGG